MKLDYKKPLLMAGVASTIALTGATGVGVVSAATDTSVSDGPTTLIEKIASKFNLNKDEVKAVFDEERSAHEAKRQKAAEDRLTQAVTNSKITSEQKDKILAKQKAIKAEMDSNRDSMQGKTEAERKAAMDARRTELEQWAKDNNVPAEYLQPSDGHGGPGGPGGRPDQS